MIAAGTVRPILVAAQVIFTFGAANVGGAFAALNYQDQQVQAATSSINAGQVAFNSQVKQAIADGLPQAAVDPIVRLEKDTLAQPLPPRTFFIDRARLASLQARASAIGRLRQQLVAVEVQAEVDLHAQLVAALSAIAADVKPGKDAGLDTATFEAYLDATDKANQDLKTPAETQKLIDAARAEDAQLKQATAQMVAAAQALQSARAGATSAVATAQAALQAAQAIPVLNVTSAAGAISVLSDRLAHATLTADFEDIASAAQAQAYALHSLVAARQSAYDLLAATRDHIDLAQKAGKDVTVDATNLVPAAAHLDAAADSAAIRAAAGEIQAIKNDVDSKYWQAIYGHGKVIVVSLLKQELMALQDGVVLQDTVITSGRPALPTPPGLYHIFYKASPYLMHSPWPPGNQYWYPDVHLKWAMEFIEGGYFLHDAYWRTQFGPGSDSLHGGTHGCVNVPNAPMEWLYGWADMGTTVVVLSGDFGSSL